MRRKPMRVVAIAAAIAALALSATGCPGGGGGGPSEIFVSATGGATGILRGNTLVFAATDGEGNSPQVNWEVTPTARGSITSAGVLRVPAEAVPGPLLVTATLQGNPDVTASASMTVIAITITPTLPTVVPGSEVQFSASILPAATNQSVTWGIVDATGVSSIDEDGVLTVPMEATVGEFFVTAAPVVNQASTAMMDVVVAARPGVRQLLVRDIPEEYHGLMINVMFAQQLVPPPPPQQVQFGGTVRVLGESVTLNMVHPQNPALNPAPGSYMVQLQFMNDSNPALVTMEGQYNLEELTYFSMEGDVLSWRSFT